MGKVIDMGLIIDRERHKAKQVYLSNPYLLFSEKVRIEVPLSDVTYWQQFFLRWLKHFAKKEHPELTLTPSSWCQEWFRLFDELLVDLESWRVYGEKEELSYPLCLNHLEAILIVQCLKWERKHLTINGENHRRAKSYFQKLWKDTGIKKQFLFLLFMMEEYLENESGEEKNL